MDLLAAACEQWAFKGATDSVTFSFYNYITDCDVEGAVLLEKIYEDFAETIYLVF